MSIELTKTSDLLPPSPLPSQQKELRRLFLLLFLRGRSSRGLKKETAPTSIGTKLALSLGFYVLFGMVAFAFLHQPLFALSVYLHAMTFVFLGMFVAASAGEILFNKEEADILLHRPVSARMLLFAKARVLVEVSLWLAVAFNLGGFVVGFISTGWRFPIVHATSTILEALFCTGCVIMVYQLCLRWFGREKLDGMMTTSQVVVSVAAVMGGQLLPQFALHANQVAALTGEYWWIVLLPPAWFAGFDDALAGSGAHGAWLLTGLAIAGTALVSFMAFSRLAHDYGSGLQRLNDTVSTRKPGSGGRRWLDLLVRMPPLSWFLRDPVTRASFLLSAAYLTRDRDMKLRFYPSIAPMLVMPLIMVVRKSESGSVDKFALAFTSAFVGMIPVLGIISLQYSQQWLASDVFRAAPMIGPAALCAGARRAVFCFVTVPIVALFGILAWRLQADSNVLVLALPGIIAMPVYAMMPNVGGGGVPLSLPTEESKSAGRGTMIIAAMLFSFIVAAISTVAWSGGWFGWFMLVESVLMVISYAVLRFSVSRTRWKSAE